MKKFIVSPGRELSGELRVASDKSISHRAVMLSALAVGETEIINPLGGDDVRRTVAVLRACGVEINDDDFTRLRVSANGELTPPAGGELDCGNSGTLMRLFCGIAVGWDVPCTLVGDASLMSRPMARISKPLARMGASLQTAEKGRPPLVVEKRKGELQGILHSNSLSSAQVKSALLLAGLRAKGSLVVAEPIVSRDHTERLLELFGVPMRRSDDGRVVEIVGEHAPTTPGRIDIPADISSAFFFAAAAAITPNSDITLLEVGINPTRSGSLELLMRMGADVDIMNRREMGNELVADVRVRGGELHGIEIGGDMVPSAVDDFPALFIAAAAARGTTRLTGAVELRRKESDRLSAMAIGLKTLDVECEEQSDGIVITGKNGGKPAFSGGEINSQGDHRIAMAFAMASLRAKSDIIINDTDNVRTSFPNFVKIAAAAGMRIVEEEEAEEAADG